MSNKKTVNEVIGEFIDTFDEFVLCMSFATQGIHKMGQELAKSKFDEGHQTWVGSNCEENPKMHARMKTTDCIKKCAKNGDFSNEITKSLLCTMYALWDEAYRHHVAEASGHDARYIECPLMGDLRKLRHCIIHQKSIVPESSIDFEILGWRLPPGKLEITYEMFLEFNDAVRGEGMKIRAFSPPPALQELLHLMTKNERKSFDSFFKNRENRVNNIEWPELDAFLNRIGHAKMQSQ
ncbi:hypothetical protein AAV96_08760 [Acinetobacter sp. AG1]|uniref:hypothetical protein n=1 Tax=Acinetobacter TaxID=469 RepID=UPI0006299780|nr:hypothetical protein [Acinetobacter sp. AG1]KKW79269.1 hypothetical protein AAV96_08760 [Acinetobacter sp. AG1]